MSKSSSKKICDSWVCRIVILVALLISFLAFTMFYILLSCNEENAIYRAKALEEAQNIIFDKSSQLVHVTSHTFTSDTLIDKTFNIFIPHAIKLRRVVEMYQWNEYEIQHEDGGKSQGYAYTKVWSEHELYCRGFHNNPSMPIQSKTSVAKEITFGEEFTLSPSLIAKIDRYKHLKITEDIQMPNKLYNRKLHINQGGYYLGNNPNSPQIGDLRIKFDVIYSKEVISVIAKRVGSQLSAYQTKHFKPHKAVKENGYIELLEYGAVGANRMLRNEKIANFFNKLPARISGFFILFIGIYMAFVALGRLEKFLPFASSLVEWSRNWISLAVVAIAVSFISIAFFWLDYMPILAITLIAIAIIFLVFLKFTHQLQEVPQLLEPMLYPERVIPHKNWL